MNDRRDFETTSIHLAAALLVQVPEASLLQIASSPSIDGKRLITIRYPASEDSGVRQLVEQFLQRRLSINLFRFNRALNALRDRLKENS